MLYTHPICICYVNPIGTYCKEFRGNRHNREAISVRAVWLPSKRELKCIEIFFSPNAYFK